MKQASLGKRILLVIVMIIAPIYGAIALSICWILMLPFGKSFLREEIETSFVDLFSDVPRAWKIILTGSDR